MTRLHQAVVKLLKRVGAKSDGEVARVFVVVAEHSREPLQHALPYADGIEDLLVPFGHLGHALLGPPLKFLLEGLTEPIERFIG